jgi:hypothetical protein
MQHVIGYTGSDSVRDTENYVRDPMEFLRQYATSRKISGSIPGEVIGFFNWPNPSSSTMALGSTQPIAEMSTRNLPGV